MTIGERLKQERERLGFTQPSFAALAETTKKSQIDYEKDITQPKAGYLAAIAKVGADIQYIVTGASASSGLPSDESELLTLYRAAPLAVKMAAVGALQAGAAPAKSGGMSVTFAGENKGAVAETIIGAGVVRVGKKT